MRTKFQCLLLAALASPAFGAEPGAVLTVLHTFVASPNGGNPLGTLVQGSDRNFYGTTMGGGTKGYGTVFTINANGVLSTLYSFAGGNDGASPCAGLVQGSDGNFYGTTVGGGAYTNQYGDGFGTVFKISTNGALTTLYSFTGGSDGAGPYAGLVQASDGYFYGTTVNGGTNGSWGTVFKISTNGAPTILYSFAGGNDGGWPTTGLVQGSDGYLYGTTSGLYNAGLKSRYGTVFRIGTDGTFTNLYSFTGGNDSADPSGALVQDSDVYFYGTTVGNGTSNFGTIFRISSEGALTRLYSFTGGSDGASPHAGLVRGSDDAFYGTTSGDPHGQGTVFRMSTSGSLTVLYSFSGGNDGANPRGGLVRGSDGYFYGTTVGGGVRAATVFRITSNGVLTSLYSFNTGDSYAPVAGLAEGSDGALYGTTTGENFLDGIAGGAVFRINKDGGNYAVLHSFRANNDLSAPRAELLEASDGALYGTAYCFTQPNSFRGRIFKLNKDGSNFSTLHRFTPEEDSGYYESGLVEGKDGALYGTTSGYPNTDGILYKINRDGTAFNILYRFGADLGDAGAPVSVIAGNDGCLYGTTSRGGSADAGTVFSIQPDGSHYRMLHEFVSGNGIPRAGLLLGSDGALYGTLYGGTTAFGSIVFKLQKDGSAYQVLLRFELPGHLSTLTEGHDGFLYGTKTRLHTNSIFRVGKTGTGYMELYSLDWGLPSPLPRVVPGSDGAFYGTTSVGGDTSESSLGGGTVFKLWPPETPEISVTRTSRASPPEVSITGVVGSQYQLFRSSDLTTWTLLSTFFMPAEGIHKYVDETSTYPAGFYRAVWVQ
jgi:uncharacterized repeat protein (TIGR03803 family)